MLLDEAKVAVSLTHPNISQLYELGHEQGDYFLVMEYISGVSLDQVMQTVDRGKKQALNDQSSCFISWLMLPMDFHHAHAALDANGIPMGIVHRDISPQNILVSHGGDVKLIDFGIAISNLQMTETIPGRIRGKLRYLAPEVVEGGTIDRRSDIFCCAIVLFELLSGEHMYNPRTEREALDIARQAKVRSPRSRNPEVPRELDDIVMRALARSPADRFENAGDFASALRRFLNYYDPLFVGSDLQQLMMSRFSREAEKERRLNNRAEALAIKLAAESPKQKPKAKSGRAN